MLSIHPCPSGETGKHLALKMRRRYPRLVGSSPTLGTRGIIVAGQLLLYKNWRSTCLGQMCVLRGKTPPVDSGTLKILFYHKMR